MLGRTVPNGRVITHLCPPPAICYANRVDGESPGPSGASKMEESRPCAESPSGGVADAYHHRRTIHLADPALTRASPAAPPLRSGGVYYCI